MSERDGAIQTRIPVATYRLQFNHQFTLKQAAALVGYLDALGISDCYASPLFLARRGSLHGYDVTDHSKLNPELGTEEDFRDFTERLKAHGMGLIIDVVPNHMCIASPANRWWNDLLENGPSSPFAHFLDIDWHPPKATLNNKVLLPVLGDQYGRVLENQEIRLDYRRGAFFSQYYETRLPIAPRTYTQILELILPQVKASLGEAHLHVLELESIITALAHLPPRTETDLEKIKERRREKEIIKRRLAALVDESSAARQALQKTIKEFNGVKGEARSFDRLEELLASQAYRLCFWRVAADEINYRRFFDINELAAIRVENPAVFAAVHELVFRWMKQGRVTGLRIDHVDGLYDPEQYLRDLQRGCFTSLKQAQPDGGAALRRARRSAKGVGRPCFVVVEKILGQDESLPEEWATHGTTGYDFLNLLNGIFVETANRRAFEKLYQRFTGSARNFEDHAYTSKRLILRVAMSGELHVLARRLDRISEQHRYSRDFTLNSLQYALGEVIASFPVYRSYTRSPQVEVRAEDRKHVMSAMRAAKRRNPSISPSIFEFIQSILLLEDPAGLDEAQRAERRDFVMRFQQLTGPVTAKGIEDTAFYRYYPLASLNEVGGEPARFGVSRKLFHHQNQQRLETWPHSFSATATHDTKRGEDVRARINVLSEIPLRWYHAIRRWEQINRAKKIEWEGRAAPDVNEEYLLYQMLLGAWPLVEMDVDARAQFIQRMQEYMVKAIKEAKIHSSWINPNDEYEQAVRAFVRAILEPGEENQFLPDFLKFQALIAHAGISNSLSQTLIKITAPGVPDFYQGTELWDFNLVDPDNRRPVDYALRQTMLDSLRVEPGRDVAALVDRISAHPADGRIKLYLASRALNFRREHHRLFTEGAYQPLHAEGGQEHHVIAFARTLGEQVAMVVAGRLFTRLGDGAALPTGEVWGETKLRIPDELAAGNYRDVLTDQKWCLTCEARERSLPLSQVFAHLPVALLERTS